MKCNKIAGGVAGAGSARKVRLGSSMKDEVQLQSQYKKLHANT